MAQIPQGPVLTRLVVDEGDNLYWVVNGQRRQVNLWKEVLANDSYQGVPTSPLDLSLNTLPSRGGLPYPSLIRQD